jgi:hypothetical protein
MSPATSAQVRQRQAARRNALERQQQLNEERRRRDELEIELAADFALSYEESRAAQEAVAAAELAMGRLIDRMVGELRVRYQRAAQLLEVPEDELRRLRQLATDAAQNTDSAHQARTSHERTPKPGTPTRRGTRRSRREPTNPATATGGEEMSTPVADGAAGHGGEGGQGRSGDNPGGPTDSSPTS